MKTARYLCFLMLCACAGVAEATRDNNEENAPPVNNNPKTVAPTASTTSMEEAKRVANNNNEENINPKKPQVPDFPGQSDGSGGWIEFETPISKSDTSKSCQ